MKKRIAVSAIAQVAGQVLAALVGVFVLKVMTKQLGVQGYGIYATALAFVTTFSLLTDIGLNAITAREIAREPKRADEIIGYNMGLRLALCLVMLPIIALLGFIVYRHQPHELQFGILFFSSFIFFDAIRSVALAYFAAKVRNDVTAVINASQQIIMLIIVAMAAILSWGIYGFIGAFVVSNVYVAIISVLFARKQVNIFPKISVQKWKSILYASSSIGIIQIVNMLYLKADTILLSTIKGPVEAGIYGVAYSLILAFMTLPSFIMGALIPSMATAKGDELGAIVEKAYRYMAIFACLLAVGGFVTRYNLVLLISSTQFMAAATPFAILAAASAFSYLNYVFGFASVAVNKHQKNVYASLFILIFNISINFILIPRYSIVGAAISTVLCEFLMLVLVYRIFSKATGVRVALLRHMYRPLIAGALTIIACYGLHFLWSSQSVLFNAMVSGVLVVLIYFGLLLLMCALPEELIAGLKKLLQGLRLSRLRGN